MKREDFINDFRTNPSKYQYRIIWYIGVMKLNRHRYHVGYCTYGKGIAFITRNALSPFFVDYVIVEPEIDGYSPPLCSHGIHCKNKKCPLSRGKPRHDFEELEKKLQLMGYDFSKAKGNIMFEKPVIEIRRSK